MIVKNLTEAEIEAGGLLIPALGEAKIEDASAFEGIEGLSIEGKKVKKVAKKEAEEAPVEAAIGTVA